MSDQVLNITSFDTMIPHRRRVIKRMNVEDNVLTVQYEDGTEEDYNIILPDESHINSSHRRKRLKIDK